MAQSKALLSEHQSCETMLPLTPEVKGELRWWLQSLVASNGRNIITLMADLVITTDSSSLGWGAECQGLTKAGLVESDHEPAACECLGAAGNRLCSPGLCKESDLQSYPHTDGQHHSHGPDQQNLGYLVSPPAASMSGSLEFLPQGFKYSQGRPYSGHRECNSRLSRVDSSRTGAIGGCSRGSSSRPHGLIGRCLAKGRKEGVTMVLVALVWPAQPWYATLLNMLAEETILLPLHGCCLR